MVPKSGSAAHINNVELGRYGRNRTNVWDYPGVNTFGDGRKEALTFHPTVKPVALGYTEVAAEDLFAREVEI